MYNAAKSFASYITHTFVNQTFPILSYDRFFFPLDDRLLVELLFLFRFLFFTLTSE